MRMTIVLIASLALLCGVSLGAIIGLAVAWAWYARQPPGEAEIDYSGGV